MVARAAVALRVMPEATAEPVVAISPTPWPVVEALAVAALARRSGVTVRPGLLRIVGRVVAVVVLVRPSRGATVERGVSVPVVVAVAPRLIASPVRPGVLAVPVALAA